MVNKRTLVLVLALHAVACGGASEPVNDAVPACPPPGPEHPTKEQAFHLVYDEVCVRESECIPDEFHKFWPTAQKCQADWHGTTDQTLSVCTWTEMNACLDQLVTTQCMTAMVSVWPVPLCEHCLGME